MGITMIGKDLALAMDTEHAPLMNTKILPIAQVYPFGRVLMTALIDVGYEAELVLNGRLHVVILVIEGVKVEIYWHILPYAYIGSEYRDPSYYIIAQYQRKEASCEVHGIFNLLEVVSTTVVKLRATVQCSGCHYSSRGPLLWIQLGDTYRRIS